jgi:hypothetical protein
MSHDYLPPRDPEFNDWYTAFQLYTAAHAAELGLTPAQALEIQTIKASWGLAYSNNITAQNAAMAAKALKDTRRGAGEANIRRWVGFIQNRPETTDDQRRFLGITVRDKVPTPTDPEAIRLLSPPEIELDYSKPQQVLVHVGPEPKNEHRNRFQKPATGFRLWVLYGAIPSGTENLESLPWVLLVDHPHSPYLHIVGHAATVTYRAQYYDQLMNLGTLGPPESCAVTA